MTYASSPPQRDRLSIENRLTEQESLKLKFHGTPTRHGLPRRLPREDPRVKVGVSGASGSRRTPRRGSRPAVARAARSARRLVRGHLSDARFSSRGCPLNMREYTCTCTVYDTCTRLQNYTIGASVSVSVSVPWNLSLTTCVV